MTVNEYIKDSAGKARRERKERLLYNRIVVYIKDPLPEDFDLNFILETIETNIPSQLTYSIDSIFIGQDRYFAEKNVNAYYRDGAIYTTNEQSNEEDMLDDIVHEMAHSLEEFAGDFIYGDGDIEEEFLGKRKRLYHILRSEGYPVELSDFLSLDFNDKFDELLYKRVGYDKLTMLTTNLFVSPYAATSLREYFANGFEHYFIGEREYVRNISLNIFNKIESLIDYLQGEY